MGRNKKSFINISEAMTKLDNWRNGKNVLFSAGDVVENISGTSVGVISFPHVEVESYQVKWYVGPKPWDFIESISNGRSIKKSNKPNPLKYKNSDRFPGPASKEIDRLNEIFNQNQNKPKTGKEVDAHIAILEEEISRVYDNKKEEEIDSVVDETLDVEPNLGEIVDSVDLKRKKIIEDEV